jgi:hypothetical protein
MDAFVGNPPFMGKNGISATNGDGYIDWLMSLHPRTHGNADLSAHFFRRAAGLAGHHATIGFIATNTIAQGDTRDTGLRYLAEAGWRVFSADRSLVWPGAAAVVVSIVHLTIGAPTPHVRLLLDDQPVGSLDTRLRAAPERPDPRPLNSNANLGFAGAKLFGQGFVLSAEEQRELVAARAGNAMHIQRYIGGEEINNLPSLAAERWVINFGHLELDEARAFPELLAIAESRVRPERATNNRSTYQKYWWRLGETGTALYDAIGGAVRCLVNCQVSRNVAFAWQPSDVLFAHTLCVFALATDSAFAALQSRIHEPWARLLSSSMKTDLRYAPSDCFETFPFPQPDPRTVIPELEDIGQRLYDARAAYMIETQQGLTQTYNLLKDPACTEAPIVELRRLHEDMDRAVLAAYGWQDLEVPPFCPTTPAEQKHLETFQDQVIDRLFVLNAKRAAEEAAAAPKPAAKPPLKKPKKKPDDGGGTGQGDLFGGGA